MRNLYDIEALLEEMEESMAPAIEKTASDNSNGICQEARKLAHALRNVPSVDAMDLHSALSQAQKVSSARAREYFGAPADIFKPLDWEDGLFILSGGKYEYSKRS